MCEEVLQIEALLNQFYGPGTPQEQIGALEELEHRCKALLRQTALDAFESPDGEMRMIACGLLHETHDDSGKEDAQVVDALIRGLVEEHPGAVAAVP